MIETITKPAGMLIRTNIGAVDLPELAQPVGQGPLADLVCPKAQPPRDVKGSPSGPPQAAAKRCPLTSRQRRSYERNATSVRKSQMLFVS